MGKKAKAPGGQTLPRVACFEVAVVTQSPTVFQGPEIHHSLMLTMHSQISPESYTVHIGSGGVLLRDTSGRVLQKCVCERKNHTEYLASWVALHIVYLLLPLDYYFLFSQVGVNANKQHRDVYLLI